MIPKTRPSPTNDHRENKRRRIDSELIIVKEIKTNKSLRYLPLDVLDHIYSFLENEKDKTSFTSSNKTIYHLQGNSCFWTTFCEKVGLIANQKESIMDVEAVKDISKPWINTQEKSLKKFTLNNSLKLPIEINLSYRDTLFTHLKLSPDNQFKFKLFKLRSSKQIKINFINNLDLIAVGIFKNGVDEPTRKYIASKHIQIYLNSESSHTEEQNADDTRVDLLLYGSRFLTDNFKELFPDTLSKEFYSACIRYMSAPTIDNDNYYARFAKIKDKLISSGNKALAIRADLFMGKALYYLEEPTNEQIIEAHTRFKSVIASVQASKQDKQAAKFYSLMLCFRKNGNAENLDDETLAKNLIELNNDKTLPDGYRNWVQARLFTMRREGRTEQISDLKALHFCKEIHQRCHQNKETHSLINDLACIYGSLFAILCNTNEKKFNRDDTIYFTYNQELQLINQYSLSMQVLKGQNDYLAKRVAIENLQQLAKNKNLTQNERTLAKAVLEDDKSLKSGR